MAEYTIILDPDEEGKGYTVTVPALPGCALPREEPGRRLLSGQKKL